MTNGFPADDRSERMRRELPTSDDIDPTADTDKLPLPKPPQSTDNSETSDASAFQAGNTTGVESPTEPLSFPKKPSISDSPQTEHVAHSEGSPPENPAKRTLARRLGMAAAAVIGVGVLAYVADVLMCAGQVARGTIVAGTDIGGMATDSAIARLHGILDAKPTQRLSVRIGSEHTDVVPQQAGLSIDWAGTRQRISSQPLNPLTRLTSFFTQHTVMPATKADDTALNQTISRLQGFDKRTVEGAVVFQDGKPVPIYPVAGRILDVAPARERLLTQWPTDRELVLPVTDAPVSIRKDAVDQALHTVAEPAVSAPVTVTGADGKSHATLTPQQIAQVLSFVPDTRGGLTPRLDPARTPELLGPALAATETPPKDAGFLVSGSKPVVVPGVVGNTIDWPKTLASVPTLLTASGPGRTGPAAYHRQEPALTTTAAENLHIVEPIGEFTTGGFTGPSGVNIRTVAKKVDGAIIKPGETFSLNGFTGPRGIPQGYVESGIINHGRPDKAVGGGISQFATTLYNAAYFGGLEDAGHTEHSYYISRYPEAREATVFEGAIDLLIRNNTPNGVYIQTSADNATVTVRLWGTKTVEVKSITGERSKPTDPPTVTLPAGDKCAASKGIPGFTTSNTRVIIDRATKKEISRHTRTVKYDPEPTVVCQAPSDTHTEPENTGPH